MIGKKLEVIKNSYRLNYLLIKYLSKYKDFNHSNNFCLFADPRGGSTWLAEMIKEIPKTELMWEPLHTHYDEELQSIGFGKRQYLPNNHEWTEASQAIDDILNGKKWNPYSSRATNFLDLIRADHLLIKICRGNRLIPWILENYQFVYKPIYMVRHPFAVVHSQLKQGSWIVDRSSVLDLNTRFVGFENEHRAYLSSLESREEMMTASWCLSNKEAISYSLNNPDIIFTTYEELVINPEEVIDKIFSMWKIDIPSSIDPRKPSSTIVESVGISAQKQLSKWKEELSPESVRKMLEVIEYFQIDLYDASLLPSTLTF